MIWRVLKVAKERIEDGEASANKVPYKGERITFSMIQGCCAEYTENDRAS
jgi:hypothetical protein